MRYSLKTYLVAISTIAIVVGTAMAYKTAWKRHCNGLEPSLYAFLLKEELEFRKDYELEGLEFEGRVFEPDAPDAVVIFSNGYHQEAQTLMVPSQQLMDDIGLESVSPASETDEPQSVYSIHIKEWIDWKTVVVNHGFCGGWCGTSFPQEKLQLIDNEWQFIDH